MASRLSEIQTIERKGKQKRALCKQVMEVTQFINKLNPNETI